MAQTISAATMCSCMPERHNTTPACKACQVIARRLCTLPTDTAAAVGAELHRSHRSLAAAECVCVCNPDHTASRDVNLLEANMTDASPTSQLTAAPNPTLLKHALKPELREHIEEAAPTGAAAAAGTQALHRRCRPPPLAAARQHRHNHCRQGRPNFDDAPCNRPALPCGDDHRRQANQSMTSLRPTQACQPKRS
eukprot:84038-Chlamydomonas_euryale.AAC.6